MQRKVFALLTFILCTSAFASSGGGAHHEPSIKDLMWPAINFVALFGSLIFLTKNKISQAFTSSAQNVEQMITFSEQKDREAQIKLDMLQKKLESFETQRQRVFQEAQEDLEKFTRVLGDETNNEMNRIKRDAENKLETEKKQALSELNSELLDHVIGNAKKQIAENRGYKEKAAEKLLSSIH